MNMSNAETLSLYHKFRRFVGRRLRLIGKSTNQGTPPPTSDLQMVWSRDRYFTPPTWPVPAGYFLRTYQEGDALDFFVLMERAGFPGWNMIEFEKWCLKILPDGFFFVIDSATGKLAATAMACHNPTALHPFGATLSCVAADPLHRGRGLGYVVSAAVTQRLLQAGYLNIYLETDDWRLAAIKTYLNMGWVPLLYRQDMPARWEKICATLDLRYTPETWKAYELTTVSTNANN